MRFKSLAFLFVLFAGTLAARADSIFTFNINGAGNGSPGSPNSDLVTGTTTIDTTTGVVQAISFTAGGAPFSGVDSQANVVIRVGGDPMMSATQAVFSFEAGSLIGYDTGDNNSFNLRLPSGELLVGHVTGGMMVMPPAATPEPSSIALLGTGLLGIAGVVRRRFV